MGNKQNMAENISPRIYGVAEINSYLQEYLAEDEFLRLIAIRGEVSGFLAHSSGHIYFTLKEKESSLKVVMFRRFAENVTINIKNGDQIVVFGGISLYTKDAVCQLYAEEIFAAGGGEQAKALSELKEKLAREGLFKEENKKPLPRFIFDVGVITSPQGAGWADIKRVAAARNPNLALRIYPALVQGEQAPDSLVQALLVADKAGHDVLIIGRGGGAAEDLAAFDNEAVVRAIAASRTPIISAVGHESDFCLSDLAADYRAATPTHAASIAVTERQEMLEILADIREELAQIASNQLQTWQQQMARYDVQAAAIRALDKQSARLLLAMTRLTALNPLATLERGYAIVQDEEGRSIGAAAQVNQGDLLEIYPAKGKIYARVEDIENG